MAALFRTWGTLMVMCYLELAQIVVLTINDFASFDLGSLGKKFSLSASQDVLLMAEKHGPRRIDMI
jgi:hypothetical protein